MVRGLRSEIPRFCCTLSNSTEQITLCPLCSPRGPGLGVLCQVQQHQFAPSTLPVRSQLYPPAPFPSRLKAAQQAVAVSSVSPPAPFQNVPPAVSQTPVIAATPVPTITATVPPVAAPAAAAPPPPAAPIMPVVPPTPPVVKVNPGSSAPSSAGGSAAEQGWAASPRCWLRVFLLSSLAVELEGVENNFAGFSHTPAEVMSPAFAPAQLQPLLS